MFAANFITIHIRRLAGIIAAGAGIGFLLYTYLYYSELGSMPNYRSHRSSFVIALAVSIVAAGVIHYLRGRLNKWLPWQQMITVRFLAGVTINTLLALLCIASGIRLYMVEQGQRTFSLQPEMQDGIIKIVILTFLTVFIYTIVDFTLYSYKQFARQQIESVKLTQTQLALQLQILRNQLSPHFLFNSMNTISALVYQDTKRAEQFIRKLAQTYQYILATNDKPLVTLAEEVAFLKAYLFLLESRFEGALEVKLNLPEHTLTSKIPPLTLQLLIENAVKHNQVTNENPLLIKVYVDMYDQITVKNTIQEKAGQQESFRVGLENIKGRYHYITSKQIQVTKDIYFTVKLPLITDTSIHAGVWE